MCPIMFNKLKRIFFKSFANNIGIPTLSNSTNLASGFRCARFKNANIRLLIRILTFLLKYLHCIIF